MTQLALDLADLVTPDYEPEASLADRFAAFHGANPHIADVFESLIEQWLVAGNERVGMKAVAEVLRWEAGLRMPGEAWAINNSYIAFYAREMLRRRPEWSDRIQTRSAVADST